MLRDWGEDPAGGKFYNRYERTRVETLYTQAIDKERTLREEARQAAGGKPPRYVMNLANGQRLGALTGIKHSHTRLEIIAEKVEKRSPDERMNTDGFDPSSFEVTATRHQEKIPPHKWDLPCTRAQEIGWLISKPATVTSIRARHKKKIYDRANDEALAGSASGSPQEGTNNTALSSSLSRSNSAPTGFGVPSGLPHGEAPRGLQVINNRQFYKPKTFCPITKYADVYMSLMHHDPFSKSAERG